MSDSLFRTTFSGLQRRPVERALLLMTGSAMLFGAMAFTAKLASATVPGPEIAVFRFLVGLVPCLFVPRYRHSALKFDRIDLLLYRGIFGGLAVLFYFLAIQHINVGVATLLNYTAPIFSGLLSVIFIGEILTPKVLIPLPVALTGIFLVVHAHAAPGDILGFGQWELIGLASAIASGAAVTAMRAARRSENSWSVYAAFCALGLVVNAPLAIMQWHWPSAGAWFWIAATAIFAMGAQLLMTFSLRWVDAMTVGVISQLAVIVSVALAATILHERITPMIAAGIALTISGVCGVVYFTSLSKRVVAADEVAPES